MITSDRGSPDTLLHQTRRISIAQIDGLVAAHLGPARVRGNAQPAVLYRQIAMYLAKKVGGWSAAQIGRFYNGRDHSTVCHAVAKVELLRRSRPEIEEAIDRLIGILQTRGAETESQVFANQSASSPSGLAKPPTLNEFPWTDDVVDALAMRIADRVISRLSETTETNTASPVSTLRRSRIRISSPTP